MVHIEPAIKHGVLALSAIHQNFVAGHEPVGPNGNQNKIAMVSNYARAVKSITALFDTARASSTVEKILSACIIFATIESLIENPVGARMHLRNGLRIRKEEQIRQGQISGRQWNRRSIVSQALERLDCGVMTISLVSAPHLAARLDKTPSSAIPSSFPSLKDAERSMFRLIRDMSTLGEDLLMTPTAFELAAKGIHFIPRSTQQLIQWKSAFETLAEGLEDDRAKTRSLLLRLYHKMIYIISIAGRAPTEMEWDQLDNEFMQMLEMVESISVLTACGTTSTTFSLELGIVPPLFFIACRCRHPQLRRRAIRYLREQRRKEMVWESVPAATLAEWIMRLEESGEHPKSSDGRVNNLDRARIVGVEIRLSQSKILAQAWFPFETNPGQFRKVESMFDICVGSGRKEACVCSKLEDFSLSC